VKGTKIVITATTPLVFSTDTEREVYAAGVARTVQAHGAYDVTVETGDEAEFVSPWEAFLATDNDVTATQES
jgi:hypothetical protein